MNGHKYSNFQLKKENVDVAVQAMCVLHNFLTETKECSDMNTHCQWGRNCCNSCKQCSEPGTFERYQSAKEALQTRDLYKNYLNSQQGSVHWHLEWLQHHWNLLCILIVKSHQIEVSSQHQRAVAAVLFEVQVFCESSLVLPAELDIGVLLIISLLPMLSMLSLTTCWSWRRTMNYSAVGNSFFFFKFWRTWVLFVGPLIPLFWTSGDISSGFQSQSGFCLIQA